MSAPGGGLRRVAEAERPGPPPGIWCGNTQVPPPELTELKFCKLPGSLSSLLLTAAYLWGTVLAEHAQSRANKHRKPVLTVGFFPSQKLDTPGSGGRSLTW